MKKIRIKDKVAEYRKNKAVICRLIDPIMLWHFAVLDLEDNLSSLERLLTLRVPVYPKKK